MTVALVGALVLVLVVAAFAIQNSSPVTVQFLAWSWPWDAGRLVAASAAVGALASLIVVGIDDLKLRLRLRQAVRRAGRLENRLATLESERDRLAQRLELLASQAAREAAPGGADEPDAPHPKHGPATFPER